MCHLISCCRLFFFSLPKSFREVFMMNSLSFLFFCLFLSCAFCSSVKEEKKFFEIEIVHSFDGIHYFTRGTFTYKVGSSIADQAYKAKITQNFSEKDLLRLKENAENNELYFVGLIVNEDRIISSVLASELLSSHGSDEMTVQLGLHNVPVALHYFAKPAAEGKEFSLTTRGRVVGSRINPPLTTTPSSSETPVSSEAQNQKQSASKEKAGEENANQGFFAKYWMYILPVVLLMLINGQGQGQAAAPARK
eukprot:GCRY01001306.1.p1 GENE.GCRY01001306.1~~GCRY01001306.1.p1  ORF type:complete len:250 (+),score=48.45 GCRY01001306.1:127-876(+)